MAFIQFQKCLTDPKQLLKLVILVVCVCITIYQLAQCIQRLNHPPVSTYYNFQLNETITYPHVTICREKPYKTHLFPKYGFDSSITEITFKQFAVSFPFNKTTISEFLQDVTYSGSENVYFYSFQGDGSQVSGKTVMTIVENYFLTLGRCQTFIPKKLYFTNSSVTSSMIYLRHNSADKVKQHFSLSNQYGYKIFIHDASEFPSGDRNEQDNLIDTIFIDTNEEMQVSFSVEVYHKISTSDRPCIDLPGYSYSKCQQTCVHNQLAAMNKCTLPWLRNLNQTYPECNDTESLSKIITLLKSDNKNALKSNCNCQFSCNTAIYSTKIRGRRDLIAMSGIILSNIAFTFDSNMIKSMSEVISYNWNSFVSDIGGSLGFLLGLSVIGVISVIEEILKIMFCKRKDTVNGQGGEEFEKNGGEQDQDEGGSDITMEKSEGGVVGNNNGNELRNFVEFLSYYDHFEKGDESNNKY